jgi:hypothetical protein
MAYHGGMSEREQRERFKALTRLLEMKKLSEEEGL